MELNRENIRAHMRARYEERRDALDWLNSRGRLTAKGRAESLSWLVGYLAGIESLAGKEAADSFSGLAWLASIRDVQDVLCKESGA